MRGKTWLIASTALAGCLIGGAAFAGTSPDAGVAPDAAAAAAPAAQQSPPRPAVRRPSPPLRPATEPARRTT